MKYIYTMFIIFYPYFASSNPCKNWPRNCKEIQEYRQKKIIENNSSNTEAGLCCMSNIPPNKVADLAINIGVSTKKFSSQRFNECLDKEAGRLKSLQREDINHIQALFRKEGISSIEFTDVENIFSNPRSAYNHYKNFVKNDEAPYFYYQNYTLSGPIQNLDEAMTGFQGMYSPDLNTPKVKKYDNPGLERLKGRVPPKRLLKFLFDHAKSVFESENMISTESNRNPLTPTIAKLLLVEIYRAHVANNQNKMRKLFNGLKLKFDYKDPFSKQTEDTNTLSVHNGYFLGSMPEHFPSKSNATNSNGHDCTSITQHCLSSAGVRFDEGFKLLSSRLSAMNTQEEGKFDPTEIAQYKKVFENEKFLCEKQLRVGDIIAFNGHVFIFKGYKLVNGKYELESIEAIAGEHRSFGKFTRNLYQDNNCSKAVFSSSGQTKANIIRIKK